MNARRRAGAARADVRFAPSFVRIPDDLSDSGTCWNQALDPLGTHVFQPIVLGPNEIPLITDLAQARAMPELTLLSALAHCRTPGGEHAVFAALAAACPMLDSKLRVLYFQWCGRS